MNDGIHAPPSITMIRVANIAMPRAASGVLPNAASAAEAGRERAKPIAMPRKPATLLTCTWNASTATTKMAHSSATGDDGGRGGARQRHLGERDGRGERAVPHAAAARQQHPDPHVSQ